MPSGQTLANIQITGIVSRKNKMVQFNRNKQKTKTLETRRKVRQTLTIANGGNSSE